MKKNNKGFFLAETIIIVALVTTVMAFVYPNVSKLYDNYKNTSLYYDQTEDLYTLKAYSEAFAQDIIDNCNDIISRVDDNMRERSASDYGIDKIYISKYMSRSSNSDYKFNKYLKRLKITNSDSDACRLIGVFENGSKPKRYASIKIEKESLYRQLYSVPELEVGQYVELDLTSTCLSKDTSKVTADVIYGNKCRIKAIASGFAMVSIKTTSDIEIVTKVNVK